MRDWVNVEEKGKWSRVFIKHLPGTSKTWVFLSDGSVCPEELCCQLSSSFLKPVFKDI